MQRLRNILSRYPRLKALLRALWRSLRSLVDRPQGLPPISYSEVSRELIRTCVGKDNPTILDIGCNDGGTTLWLLEIFQNPTIYCFEPDPRAIARFKAQVSRRSSVTLLELALSDRDGTIEFYQSGGHNDKQQLEAMPQGWDLSGSIRQPRRHPTVNPWVTFDQKITVTTSTLDTVCEQHGIGSIDFIWMDVQGAAIDVFRGVANALRSTRFIYTEYSNKELYRDQFNLQKLVKHLKDLTIVVRYPGDVLLRDRQPSSGKPRR
jgi:FkbM family methyltransferase